MIDPRTLRACTIVALLLAALGVLSQSIESSGVEATTGASSGQINPRDASGAPIVPTPEQRKLLRVMAERRNKERQKKIEADADQLAKTAFELRIAIDASQQTELTGGETRQVEQIEKLAKDIRRKMMGDN